MENKARPRDSAKLRSEPAAAGTDDNAAAFGCDSSSASNETIPYSDTEKDEEDAKTEATLYAIPKRSHDQAPDCPQCQRKPSQPEAASAFKKLFHLWSSSVRIAESRATSLLSVDDNAVTPLRPRKKWGFRRKSSVAKQKLSTQQPPHPPPTPPPSSSGRLLPRTFPRPYRTTIKQRPLPHPQPCIEPPTANQQTPMYPALIQQTLMSCSHPAPINKTLVSCSRPTPVKHKSMPPSQMSPVKQATLSSLQQTLKPRHVASPSDPQLVPTSFKKVSLPVTRQNPQLQQMMQLLPLPSTLSSSQAPHWKPLLWPLPLQIPALESPLHDCGGNHHDDGSQTLSAKSLMVASDTVAQGSAFNNNMEDSTTHWVCLPFGDSHGAEADALLLPAAELTSIQSMTLEASQTHQGCSGNRSAGNLVSIRPEVRRTKSGICGRQDSGCDKVRHLAIGQCGDIPGNRVKVELNNLRVSRDFVAAAAAAAAIVGGGEVCNNSNNSSSSCTGSSFGFGKLAGALDTGDKEVDRSYCSSSRSSSSGSGSSSDSSCLHFGVNPHDFSVVSENPFKALRLG